MPSDRFGAARLARAGGAVDARPTKGQDVDYYTNPGTGAIVSWPERESQWRCRREGRIVEVVGRTGERIIIRNVVLGRNTTVAMERFHRDYEPLEEPS